MDRVVWLIVVTVVTHFMLEYSGALAQTHVRNHGSVAAQYQLPNRASANAVVPNDVELIDPARASGTVNNGRSGRIQLLDNIFKVSEYVRTIFFVTTNNHISNCCPRQMGICVCLRLHSKLDPDFHTASGQ